MMGTLTRVAVAALIFSLKGAARSADPPRSDKTPISDNVAVVEIAAPAPTRILIDGKHEKSSRVTFGPLKKGQLAQHELTAQFASGETVSKTLLLRGGSRYHIPLRDPRAALPEIVVQTGHFGGVWSVAFSPDGKQVLTGSGDRTAILWDAATGTMLRTFSGYQNNVMSVAFSPDAKSILTASWDKTAILWDAKTGKKLHTFEGYDCAAFSPDGRWVVTGSLDKSATLWDCATGKRLRQFEGDPEARKKRQAFREQAEVTAVAFSADGKRVLTGEAGNQAIVWDAETGEQLRTFKGHRGLVASVAFSPDGKSILTGAWDNTAILWDAATGAKIRTFSEHARGAGVFFPNRHYVTSVAFSPDGKSILTGSWDRTAVLSDVSTGKTLRIFKGHDDHVTSVAFSPDGKRVLTGSRESRAILWDVSNGNRLVTFEGRYEATVASIALSPDERLLAAGYRDGKAALWDTATGTGLGTLDTQQRFLASVAFSPDGKQMLTGSMDGAILWNSVTRDKLRTFKGSVQSAAFSPDGKTVVTWDYAWSGEPFARAPMLWDAATGAKLRTFKAENRTETCLAFSPDGKQILIAYYNGTVGLWDAATGNKLGTFKEDRGTVTSVAFSPDGKCVLTGFGNGTALLWSAGMKEKLREFAGHKSYVQSVAFSPDGKQVLTGSKEQTIVLWDAATGNKLRTFAAGQIGSLRCVVFSPNGRFILSGSDDGTARVWDIASGDELCRLIALAGDDWLSVTPEGLFDGSPGGIRKLTYRIKNELSVVPAEKLNKDFQHRGLLARLWKGERPQPRQSNK
jgi:WD40 repeat protein